MWIELVSVAENFVSINVFVCITDTIMDKKISDRANRSNHGYAQLIGNVCGIFCSSCGDKGSNDMTYSLRRARLA